MNTFLNLGNVYLHLTSVAFLWGTSFAAAKIGMLELSPFNLTLFRFSIASLVFALILLSMGKSAYIQKKDVPMFFFLGFLVIPSYFYMQFTGLLHTTTINSAIIIATSPIFTALFSHILKLDIIKKSSLIGILVAFTGVFILITNGNFTNLFHSATIKGDLLILFNALIWSGFTIYGKNILTKYSPFTAIAYIHILGTLPITPLAFFPNFLTPTPLIDQLEAISTQTILLTLHLALLCSVYCYFMWYNSIQKIGAVRTAVFTYLSPLFAILFGVLILNEAITRYTFIGGMMVLIGVYYTNRNSQKDTYTKNANEGNFDV